jgi:PncC family amidohydrolase
MELIMKEVVEKLIKEKKTISTMESCTGGGLVNAITNIPGASEILKFSAVTYSNEFKIKMGVSSKIIEEYSVYSMETAKEMSKNISNFTSSTYGVGITGKLCRSDVNNKCGKDNVVYISIYDSVSNRYHNKEIDVMKETRPNNKELVIDEVVKLLLSIED